VLQDRGTVKNDQGLVQFDQVQIDFCHITAPFAGRVGLRLVDPGNVVQATGIQSSSSMPLAVITQLQPITVVFPVPEDSIDLIQPHANDGAKLVVDAYDRADHQAIESGTLLTLDNQIDTTTGTVKARAQFANNANRLFPNQFVNAHLLVTTLRGVTVIPASAIQHNGQVAFVYVLTNDVAAMRQVTPGATDGGMTQVEGIRPGDVIATSGFARLQDKSKVVIAHEPSTGPSTAPSTSAGGSEVP
jgi:multidrug efflux system membrane fusion protein